MSCCLAPTSRPSTLLRWPTVALAVVLICTWGCNLDIDVDAHPYPDTDDVGVDAGSDTDTDVGPSPTIGPRLIVSELMIRPSVPDGTEERLGQYIEIYNSGDAPIHPTDIVIEITETGDRILVDQQLVESPEEQEVLEGLEPIEPGEFFVFLRHDDPYYQITDHLAEGTFYEYQRWNRPIDLSPTNQTLRVLDTGQPLDIRTHHEIGWRNGALVDLDGQSSTERDLRTDIALGLDSAIEVAPQASDPNAWCYHLQRFSDGPLLGSPGGPSPGSCL